MSTTVFVDEFGIEIRLDTETDISGADDFVILAQKPDGTVVEWDAELDAEDTDHHTILYTTLDGDIDSPGVYVLQGRVSTGATSVRYTEKVILEAEEALAVAAPPA